MQPAREKASVEGITGPDWIDDSGDWFGWDGDAGCSDLTGGSLFGCFEYHDLHSQAAANVQGAFHIMHLQECRAVFATHEQNVDLLHEWQQGLAGDLGGPEGGPVIGIERDGDVGGMGQFDGSCHGGGPTGA